MLASRCELVLYFDRRRHHVGRDRRDVKASALFEYGFVVRQESAAVEHLEVDNGAGGQLPVFEERQQTRRHFRNWKPDQSAPIGEIGRAQRHAPDITLGLARSRPRIRALLHELSAQAFTSGPDRSTAGARLIAQDDVLLGCWVACGLSGL